MMVWERRRRLVEAALLSWAGVRVAVSGMPVVWPSVLVLPASSPAESMHASGHCTMPSGASTAGLGSLMQTFPP